MANHSYLDPIAVVKRPREDFIRHLMTAYPLRDEELRDRLKQELEKPGVVWQHPYLEGAQPYYSANSVADLVDSGKLHSDMAQLFEPKNRPLYEHQKEAIETVVEQHKNIVVATGTGSGKTECFLIPMMDMLLKEHEQLYESGVRTLILYPMNALVNDQVKRLRKLLCRQDFDQPTIRFGFYISRTEHKPKDAEEVLLSELQSYDRQELLGLFSEDENQAKDFSTPEKLIDAAAQKIQKIQAISREEIWEQPPHILVTNYSMLEHMLIRPKERNDVFVASSSVFKLLIVDEAHTYNGSTGTEVSMLLKRFKAALNQERGKTRCIATSASLGKEETNQEILEFARILFDEPFSKIIRGKRQTAVDRLGESYTLSPDFGAEEIWEYLSVLELPELTEDIQLWIDELSYIVPKAQLDQAHNKSGDDVHKLLWFALSQHPLMHRLINFLSNRPYPWETVFRSTDLWGFDLPLSLDGSIDENAAQASEQALANLLQLGTLARLNDNDLPLLPVRLHLLFRSLEGLFQCINPDCRDIYLNSKEACDKCHSPVLEIGSCSQCGQEYVLTQLSREGQLLPLPRTYKALKDKKQQERIYTATLANISNRTEDEENELSDSYENNDAKTLTILQKGNGWIGKPADKPFQSSVYGSSEYQLAWHRQKDDEKLNGCYLRKCIACGYGTGRTYAIRRLVAYTDAPLESMIDSLFELLPEENSTMQSSKRKLLTFSDGRQDAAFFASDFQRNHTEILYRQMIWQAFAQVKDQQESASVGQVTNQLRDNFLEIPIPHPDRTSELNYTSYVSRDDVDNTPKNPRDCKDRAEKRAKELLLKEFAVAYARRSSLEAFALLACHLEFSDTLIQAVAERLNISKDEVRVFLTGLTNIIRRSGTVSISGASSYFPETGGVVGSRRPMVNAQGKTLIYLFLERNKEMQKKFRGSFAFFSDKSTRISWYFKRTFGDNNQLTKEDFIWLFRQLESEGIFVPAALQGSYHLNWDLLTLWKTQEGWYKCDSCQQVAHIPDLSEALEAKASINLRVCRAFKCEGTLRKYEHEKIEAAANQHAQQHIIKNRGILPLRSQEHTAQLGTEELAKRENNFRQGKINLLSCSTTLEMGVDIGELQAVVLRNFPPHVSNYQQRAGRAGRRTDGVAVTLMYGQRRPHDRFYFEQPQELIAGSNQIPKIDADNLQIQQRHIRAELIAIFLQETQEGIGTEKITIAAFFDLSDKFQPLENDCASPTAMISELRRWLRNQRAESICQAWLSRLNSPNTCAAFRNNFYEELDRFEKDQLSHWNDLVELLDDVEAELDFARKNRDRDQRRQLERSRDSLEIELKKVLNRRLHEQLVQAAILPIYGFPIDVVRLLTEKSDFQKSSQGKHRLERDRRLALGEYAPGQDIIVDDRVYKSVGVLSPHKLEKKFYWVCKNCNHFESTSSDADLVEKCPICDNSPNPRDMQVKEYRIPQAFITDWTQTPDVAPYLKPTRQPTSQVFLAKEGEQLETVALEGICQLTTSRNSHFFLANKGNYNKGAFYFRICESCGRDLTEPLPDQKGKKSKKEKTLRKSHKHPILGSSCIGKGIPIQLGHEFYSDLVKIKFERSTSPNALFRSGQISDNQDASKEFWRSLTYALLAAAAQTIDVRREELDGLFVPVVDGQAEIIIYDDLPGGAGYSTQIAENFQEILEKAYQLTATCSCDSSCYDCLRTYNNQIFHEELDRQIVANFLQPIVDQVAPDNELKDFAPDSHRVSLTAIADELPTVLNLVGKGSILYLPQLIDTYKLKQGSPLSWSNGLRDMVHSAKHNDGVPELVIHDLPQPTSDQNRLLRRRLSQWIDQGLLRIYQSHDKLLPELCIVTAQDHHLGLRLSYDDSSNIWQWLQTRSKKGGKVVLERLQQLRSDSTLISASELHDPDTTIILPEVTREWKNLSLDELRQKLELLPLLTGSPLTEVTYTDRYLYDEAEILSDLLQVPGIDSKTKVSINVRENRYSSNNCSTSQRKADLKNNFQPLVSQGASLKTKVQLWRNRANFPHPRSLEIKKQDGQKYRVIFDQGLAFLEKTSNDNYSVTKDSYIVITRCSDE